VISDADVARIRDQLGELALQVVRIDIDGFLEVTDVLGSPQALSHGFSPKVVASASGWSEQARLLKPFRDNAVTRLAQIREERAGDDLVPREAGCPSCGERRVDELVLNEDDSVLFATCGRRYQLPGREDA